MSEFVEGYKAAVLGDLGSDVPFAAETAEMIDRDCRDFMKVYAAVYPTRPLDEATGAWFWRRRQDGWYAGQPPLTVYRSEGGEACLQEP